MLRERRHLQLYIREERQPRKQRMEFIIRLNVEEVVVRVFAKRSAAIPAPIPLPAPVTMMLRPLSRSLAERELTISRLISGTSRSIG